MPCSDLQQYCRATFLALVSTGGVVGCGLVICVVLTLTGPRTAFMAACLAEPVLLGAGRVCGLTGCFAGRPAVLREASGCDWEKESDKKTI